MEIAIGAAHWVVSKALGPVTNGLLESWLASSELGPNVRALKLELLYAEGMLNNARGRDMHNPALGLLLLELRNLAYDADDVLDELEYFRIQDELEGTYETIDAEDRGLMGSLVLNARHTARAVAGMLKFSSCSCASETSGDPGYFKEDDAKQGCLPGGCSFCRNTTNAVSKCLPCYLLPSAVGARTNGSWLSKAHKRRSDIHEPKLKFDRVRISKKMTDIVEQLKPICAKVATILELELSGSSRNTNQGIAFDRPKTTASITEPILYGRINQKKIFVDAITNGKYDASDLTVLSIVGLGGIGKTTFTQHIYEDVLSNFDVHIWICVSLDFNANKLIPEILKKTPKAKEEKETDSEEDKIAKRIESKKVLLVLDDMWKFAEDEWKKLLAPFKKGGAKGSVVIVTTRFPKVAGQVATKMDYLFTLERLEYKDCMDFFQACVFGDQQQPWEDHAGLQNVGKDIVKKLKGSPLAVKTVGRLLRNKLTPDYWKRVLESREWELQANDDDIMPALKLSYNYLPIDLQQCFSYCALFPEDYEYNGEELIQLWIGLGLLGTSDKNKRAEDIAQDNLNELVNYGFFEMKIRMVSQPYYLVHDLLHELAVNVSYECLSVHGSDVRSLKNPTSIRHLSIAIDNTHVKDRITYENIKRELSILGRRLKAENLRTVMLFGEHHGGFSNTLADLLRKAKALRVIFLSGVSYNMEDLLHNVSDLVHLRYLRISQVPSHGFVSTRIPNGFSRFYHMMVLDLQQCNNLCGSLRETRNLVRIRHLLVPDMFHSEIFEVGKLNALQELRRFEVNKEMSGFELKQLGQLLGLRGSLEICNLERVEAAEEAGTAKLEHMDMLNRLLLDWGNDRSSKDPKKEEDVLESLKPHSNVQEVCIRGHGGTTYPKWLGMDLFNENLECLSLDGVAWRTLPPLGELWMANDHGEVCLSSMAGQSFQNLKRIELVNIERLKKWSDKDTPHLFQVLQVLIVSDCPELIELSFSHATSYQSGQVDKINIFPKLQELKISNCPKLLSMPPIPWTSALCEAEIRQVGTHIKKLSYKKQQQTKRIEVQMGKDTLDFELCNMLAFNNLTEIEEFVITECPPVSLDHLQLLASLKKLSIWDCPNVMRPVDGCQNSACYMFLEDLSIRRCGATGKDLTLFLSYFPNISKLDLRECKMVTELSVAEKLSPSDTEDTRMGQVEQHARGEEEIEAATKGLLLLPPQLQELRIFDFPDLKLCSSSLDGLGSLQLLTIVGCPKFVSSSSFSSPYCPFPTSLQHLLLNEVDGMFTLEPLSNLTYLYIQDCGDLRGDVLWPLLAQGHLNDLFIYGCPNLFIGSEPSRLDRHHPPSYRVQDLRTDGKAGILAVPIIACISKSLTFLVFIGNNDMELFTEEQEGALQILTSLQELQIFRCKKLNSLPAGLCQISSLKTLWICECESIRLWPKDGLPSSLSELKIHNCPAIRSLPKGNLPSSLQTLDVNDSQKPGSMKNNEELKRQCRKLQGTIPIIKA